MYNIIMLGIQGSGKGTQAELLSSRLGIPAVSTGNLFRAEIERRTGLGLEIAKYVEAGELIPPAIVDQAISERIAEDDALRGFILDGYPRNIGQAESLTKILEDAGRVLTDVVFIRISDEEAMRRLSGRRVCSNKKCEASYHVEFNPPQKDPNKCDRCGNDLMQRDDDTVDTIKHRLEVYHSETAPLIEFYRRAGVLREVEGEQSIINVETAIVAAIGI
ncbi:adenylate kinase [Patescibacteria group bacterium]|nr:adenylate kinase [Patescibacteria group bacterium]MBU1029474.1 adenylate kinase [Patescibacteria group bacterium]MBU1915824.1 adenylate kinase [Patescibacteria group bacterium]